MLLGVTTSTLLIWLACHFVGDFAFQSTWMSIEKGKSWEVNFYHCATYTATFILFAQLNLARPNHTRTYSYTHFALQILVSRQTQWGGSGHSRFLPIVLVVTLSIVVLCLCRKSYQTTLYEYAL